MTIEIQNLSFVENAKTVPLHFTLKLEGLRYQINQIDEETYMESWHAIVNVSWPTAFCVKPTSKKWV